MSSTLGVRAADDRACERGEDVAVGEHDEPGPECGDDLVLDAIGKVGRVEEVHGERAEGVALWPCGARRRPVPIG